MNGFIFIFSMLVIVPFVSAQDFGYYTFNIESTSTAFREDGSYTYTPASPGKLHSVSNLTYDGVTSKDDRVRREVALRVQILVRGDGPYTRNRLRESTHSIFQQTVSSPLSRFNATLDNRDRQTVASWLSIRFTFSLEE